MKLTGSYRLPINIQYQNEMKTISFKWFYVVKRIVDILASLFVIIFLYPFLIPVISLLIKLDTKGSVFFVQERVGFKGDVFKCFKFRTMTDIGDIKQITRVGKILRNTGLDELPQFINVLKGDMSIIGPRPYSLEDNDRFSFYVDSYDLRHSIRPGITGLAQVQGYKGLINDIKSIKLRTSIDLIYISNPGFVQEMKIVLLTVRLVIKELINSLWNEKSVHSAYVQKN